MSPVSIAKLALVPAIVAAIAAGAHSQSGNEGKQLFERRCGGCHALDRDKEGPRLGGVYGRKAASVPAFEYSDALKKSGIVWDSKSLDRWLTDPGKLVPDNDMPFRIARAEERRAIIAYLKQQSDGGGAN